MKSAMHDRRNAAGSAFDAPAILRALILLFIVFVFLIRLIGTNFLGLGLQFFLGGAQLLFHLLKFLVQFHFALGIVDASHLPIERRHAVVRGGVGGLLFHVIFEQPHPLRRL